METSASLLDRLRSSPNHESWKRLDDLYRPLILRWLRRDSSLGEEDANDLVQEILTFVWKELRGFERRRAGSFRAWLRSITALRVKGHYRGKKARPLALGGNEDDGPLAGLADEHSELSRRWDQEHNEHVVSQMLSQVAGEFNETDLRAFRRQVFDQASPEDVAAELGVPVNVVYLAKSRILKRLRKIGEGLLD
jgi:RNA polymerase sigma factor (sigma-70 family)